MNLINLKNLTPTTSQKMKAEKIERLLSTFSNKARVNNSSTTSSPVLKETRGIINKIKSQAPTSTKLDEEKRATLENYLLNLEEIASKDPNNIPLRTQLASIRALLAN